MSEELQELMKLQGVLRVAFVMRGIDEEQALELSGVALHVFVTSKFAKEEYYAAYEKTLDEAEAED